MDFTEKLEELTKSRSGLIKKQKALIIESLKAEFHPHFICAIDEDEVEDEVVTYFSDSKNTCTLSKVWVNYKDEIIMEGLECEWGGRMTAEAYPENYQDILLFIKGVLDNQ